MYDSVFHSCCSPTRRTTPHGSAIIPSKSHLLPSLQGKDVKEAAVLVSQVRRAGRGHGVFHVDTLLARKYDTEGDGAGPIAG